jgi:DNA repair protein RecN (Recombination protein N)
MLQSLTIHHFVIVERLEIDIDQGFTVMTGETGAGKSILIDAIDLLLGGRGDATVVREGAAKADLSAQFDITQHTELKSWLNQADLLPEDNELLLRRTVDTSGKSKAWVNGQTVTLAQLREVGEFLVDIHGQHAHQALLRPNAQRQLLDAHAGLAPEVKALTAIWRDWQKINDTLASASTQAQKLGEIRDQLMWKIEEVAALKLTAGEWESLSDEQKRLAHGAELLQTAQLAHSQLEVDDNATISNVETLAQRLHGLLEKDANLGPAAQALDQAAIYLREAADCLRHYLDKTDLDPARLHEVELRVDAVFTVARKLRTKPENLVELLQSCQAQLKEAQEAADIEGLKKLAAEKEAAYLAAAKVLSKKRARACQALSKEVNHWLAQLAMGSMQFQAVCEARSAPAASGLEEITFTLKNHATATPYPLSKVASGGELARISLAISVVTTSASQIPTLIFDEVDSGIGGNVAHTVGQLLAGLGKDRQVLCVTHLPQVAARGHHHFQVAKANAANGKPISTLNALNASARVDEIARMLGDAGAEKTSREHAKSLLALV